MTSFTRPVRSTALVAALLLVALPLTGLRAADAADDHQVDAKGGTVRQNAQMDDGAPKAFAADKNASTTREAHPLHLMEKTVTPPSGYEFRPFKASEQGLDASITNPDPSKPLRLPVYVRIPKYVDILAAPDCCFNVDVTDIEGMIRALKDGSQASPMEGPSSITVSGILPEEDHAGQFPLRIEGNLKSSGQSGEDPHWAAKVGSIMILVDRNHDGTIDGKDNTGKRLRFVDRNQDNKLDDLDNPRDDMPGGVFLAGYGLPNHPKLGDRIQAKIKYPHELTRGVLRLRILDEHMPTNTEVQGTAPVASRNRHVRVYKDLTGGPALTDAQLQWDLSASPVVPEDVYLDYASDEIVIARLTFLRQASDTTPVMTDEVKIARFSNGVGAIDGLQPSVSAIPGLGSIELMSGNLHLDALVRSYQAPALGPDLALAYNHLDGIETGLGRGWRSTYDQRVFDNTFDREGTDGKITNADRKDGDLLVLLDGSGRKWPFVWKTADSKYVSQDKTGLLKATVEPLQAIPKDPGLTDYNADDLTNGYKVLLLDNTTRWFDRDGYLMRIENLRQEKLTITRGQADGTNPWKFKHQAVKVVDEHTREEGLAASDVAGAVDPAKKTLDKASGRQLAAWEFLYDDEQRLKQVKITGNFALSSGSDLTWKIAYDPAPVGDLATSINKVSIVTIPYLNGDVKVAYTPATRMTASTKAVVTGSVPFGGATEFADIDVDLGAWKTRKIPGQVTVITTRILLADKRRISTETTGRVATTWQYDDRGNQTSQAVAGGTTVTSTWGDFGMKPANLLKTTTLNGAGGSTTYDYFNAGKQSGRLHIEHDPNGKTTTYAYDGSGFPKSTTDRRGFLWETTGVDEFGNPTASTSPEGRTTMRVFGQHAKFGLLESETDFRGFTTSYAYDARLRPSITTLPTGGKPGTVWDPLSRPITSTDARGTTTAIVYDAYGRVISETITPGDDIAAEDRTGIAPLLTDYTDGPLTTVLAKRGALIVADQDVDLQGRVVRQRVQRVLTGTTPTACASSTAFTAEGWPERLTDARGFTTVLAYDTAGRVVRVTTPEGGETVTAYKTPGWIESVTDADGHTTTTNTYDPCGRPTKVTNPKGGSVTTTYDEAGNVLATAPSMGNPTSQTYDRDGLPKTSTDVFGTEHKTVVAGSTVQVSSPVSSSDSSGPSGRTATMTWTNGVLTSSSLTGIANPVKIVPNKDGSAKEVTSVRGGKTVIGTNEAGMTVRTIEDQQAPGDQITQGATTVSPGGLILGTKSALANQATQTRDPVSGDLLSTTDSETASGGDPQAANAQVVERDRNGNTLQWKDARQRLYVAVFDRDNRQTRVTGPDGTVTRTEYTPGGQVLFTRVQGPAGAERVSESRYDELDNVVYTRTPGGYETTAGFDAFGLTKFQQRGSLRTGYIYDPGTRQLIREELPGGRTKDYQRDSFGRVVKVTDPNQNETKAFYDNLDRLTRVEYPTDELPGAPAADVKTERVTYDPATGDVATTIDRSNCTTTIARRDLQGHPLEIRIEETAGASSPVPVTLAYDPAGNCLRQEISGTFVEQKVDKRGRQYFLKGTAKAPGTGAAIEQVIGRAFYNDGTPHTKTLNGKTWSTELKANGQIDTIGFDGDTAKLIYDGDNRVARVELPGGVVRQMTYNDAGQLLTLRETVGSRTQSYAHAYDPVLGRLTGISGPGYTQSFGYDAASRLILDQRQGDQPYEKFYRYDNNGNRTSSLITSGGSSTTLGFDDGLLPAAIVPRTATWAVTAQAVSLALQADLGPQPSTLEGVASVSTESPAVVPSVAAGVVGTQVAYTASTTFAGVILRENATYRWQVGVVPQGDSAIIRGTRLTKKTKVELVLAESQPFALPSRQVTILATRINALNGWMVTAVEPSVAVLVVAPAAASTGFGLLAQTPSATMATVRFDNVSWTIGGSRASRSSTFDRWNRLRKITGTENTEFTYDDRGRLLNRKTTTATAITEDKTSYDVLARQTGFQRVVTATTPGATPQVRLDVGYAFYGTSTMRAGVKSTTGALTSYAMDGTTMLAETTGTAQNRTRYFAGAGSSPLWQKEANGDLQTYLQDGQGNVTGLVKTAADVFRFTYDAYGVTTAKNASGTAVTPPTGPRYRGVWFDSTTGQYQMGARFYTPGTGTFTTEDPIRADENDWAYAGGDPVNRWDPSGLDDIAIDPNGDAWWVFTDPTDEHELGRTKVGVTTNAIWNDPEYNIYRDFWSNSNKSIDSVRGVHDTIFWLDSPVGGPDSNSLLRSARRWVSQGEMFDRPLGPWIEPIAQADRLAPMQAAARKVHLFSDTAKLGFSSPSQTIFAFRDYERTVQANDQMASEYEFFNPRAVSSAEGAMTGAEMARLTSDFLSTVLAARAIGGGSSAFRGAAAYGEFGEFAYGASLKASGASTFQVPPTRLIRGERSSMPPAQVFSSGISPKGTNTNLLQATTSNAVGSAYVATSLSQDVAFDFAGKNGYLYGIRSGRGIDVNRVLGISSPHPGQNEYSFLNGLSPNEILFAIPKRNGVLIDTMILNPRALP